MYKKETLPDEVLSLMPENVLDQEEEAEKERKEEEEEKEEDNFIFY